jgi:hypothetical protein
MEDRGTPGSAEPPGGRLEVVGGRVDEPDRPAGASKLDTAGALLGEDLERVTRKGAGRWSRP